MNTRKDKAKEKKIRIGVSGFMLLRLKLSVAVLPSSTSIKTLSIVSGVT